MKRLIFALLICLLLAGQALAVGIIDGVGFSNYLLYDDFLTDYDSDHLNGTAPEPGPGGTKFVVDTNKVMRTSNGKLVVTAGSVGVGDPRIYWDARTRQPGKILICGKINTTAGENLIGWGDSTSTVPDIMYWDFSFYRIYSKTKNLWQK